MRIEVVIITPAQHAQMGRPPVIDIFDTEGCKQRVFWRDGKLFSINYGGTNAKDVH